MDLETEVEEQLKVEKEEENANGSTLQKDGDSFLHLTADPMSSFIR